MTVNNRILLTVLSCMALAPAVATAQNISIQGSDFVKAEASPSTGLKNIYVIENTAGATIEYRSESGNVEWLRFSNLGGGYAEPVAAKRDGNVFSINPGREDMGYIINDGSIRIAFWVVNYANHPWTVTAIAPAESDCDIVRLNVSGSAAEIPYYTVNGRREVLPRDITLVYNTLTYNGDSESYVQVKTSEEYVAVSGSINAPVPLCDTYFTLMPDKYAVRWNHAAEIQSPSFVTSAVAAETKATQTERDEDNEIKDESESLGGSAPCEITFSAAVTDAAIYRRWEIAGTPDFTDTSLTYDSLDFTYTFTEAGTMYVRFVANNDNGSCEYIGETYTVAIGESKLECPNAFSPGTSEGVNDEWKVSYRSIVSFDCQIFNRWGKKLATLTDPSQGWDGKVGGKVVGSGVYFYVIKARGADGKEYKLSGDINVISSRRGTQTDNTQE